VAVCPTGIDIRNGLQMECVNCSACIDACDNVMDKLGWERGLIRYASLNSIEKKQPFRFTGRMAVYGIVLAALIGLFLLLLFTRSAVETTLLRAPGGLFQANADGRISNLYTVKVVNKTHHEIPLTLRLEEPMGGEVKIMGNGVFMIPSENLAQSSVLILLDRAVLDGGKVKIKLGVYSGAKRLETITTSFIGPRD
jgi:polyferredoxin